jgi:hypothetical protein
MPKMAALATANAEAIKRFFSVEDFMAFPFVDPAILLCLKGYVLVATCSVRYHTKVIHWPHARGKLDATSAAAATAPAARPGLQIWLGMRETCQTLHRQAPLSISFACRTINIFP